MNSRTNAVITTIQAPTPCVRRICERLSSDGIPLIVMGDKKGPFEYEMQGTELFTLSQQEKLPFSLAKNLPSCHYARKNLGYLVAMSRGCECIYETDDDNAPNGIWTPREEVTSAGTVNAKGWLNVYGLFTSENIWPRGLPLDRVRAPLPPVGKTQSVRAPIQQGLANLSPDVDAVWRLILDKDFKFDDGPSVLLSRGVWCPFNSQTTWWWPSAYPLMYLPSFCPFRMTDIWRSFIAQRCLWEFADGVVFHHAEVDQERNFHNLMRDFADEVPGYLKNTQIMEILEGLTLKAGPENASGNLRKCYEALVAAKVFPETELPLVEAWIADVEKIQG